MKINLNARKDMVRGVLWESARMRRGFWTVY